MTCDRTLQRVSELYADLGNWPAVGRAVACSAVELGEIDAVTDRHVNRYQALANALYHGRIQSSPTLRRALGIRVSDTYTVALRFKEKCNADAFRRVIDAHPAGRTAWALGIVEESDT